VRVGAVSAEAGAASTKPPTIDQTPARLPRKTFEFEREINRSPR